MSIIISKIVCTEANLKKDAQLNNNRIFLKEIPGRKYLNSSTKLAISVSDKLKHLVVPEGVNEEDVGLCIATFGSHFEHSIKQYIEIKRNNKPLISPLLGPNNIPNSVSGQLAIYNKTKAFALTFCDAGTSGIEAFIFGAKAILQKKAKRVLVIGVESRPANIEKGNYRDPLNGWIENSVAILLSSGNYVEACEDCISYYNHGRTFINFISPESYYKGILKCLNQIQKNEKEKGLELDAVFLGASNILKGIELKAISDFTGQDIGSVYVSSNTESKVGESISALLKIHNAFNLLSDSSSKIDSLCLNNRNKSKNILINDFYQDGTLSCLILRESKYIK